MESWAATGPTSVDEPVLRHRRMVRATMESRTEGSVAESLNLTLLRWATCRKPWRTTVRSCLRLPHGERLLVSGDDQLGMVVHNGYDSPIEGRLDLAVGFRGRRHGGIGPSR